MRLLVQLDRKPPKLPVPPSPPRSKYPAAPDRKVSKCSEAAGVLHPWVRVQVHGVCKPVMGSVRILSAPVSKSQPPCLCKTDWPWIIAGPTYEVSCHKVLPSAA